MPEHTDSPEIVTPALLREWRLPELGGSKNSRGRLLVVGGARTTPGAVALSSVAALRVGAGVLTAAVARSVAVQLALSVPELGVIELPETDAGSVRRDAAEALADQLEQVDAVLFGPGLDNPDETRPLLAELVRRLPEDVPVVLDAYGIGVLADAEETAERLSGRLVLTPNTTEAAFLLHCEEDELDDPLDTAVRVAEAYGAVVTAHNGIADAKGGRWVSPTGHSGLGTAGSGDVLAGAVAGLLARGADAAQAACWGTYLHGTAGDRLAARVGRVGFLARELLEEIPLVNTEMDA
ncbi:NAD(P)H-hydrate dehydratase [Rhodococcus sp. X156]|uniref:NAD(P)H-hydrate dehydratase n=1 Tax=Rhodococcus sp. X156 TaxID=2499145 RepID=UPI000FD8C0E0|nr:NAD(P)H-hydrate dehydratase [Rhodococcus sp. X156]